MAFGYPVLLELTGRRAVVIGELAVEAGKVEGLLVAGAEVTVVAKGPAAALDRLEGDPRVVVHLEDTMAAVILEGSMRRTVPPPELARRLAEASQAKYGYGPSEEAYSAGLWALRPDRARAWTAFPDDVTRFRFG